jgi:DNA-binding PadR family transcriptional regulator
VADTSLTLADNACLALVGEGRTHGWAIVKLLKPDGELGRIWSLSRPLTYRSIDRLVIAGLIGRSSDSTDRRAVLRITAHGRRRRQRWLDEPVAHVRDLRTEFLLKLVLRDRSGQTLAGFAARQADVLAPAIGSLTDARTNDPVELWRRESAKAAQRFLAELSAPVNSSTI